MNAELTMPRLMNGVKKHTGLTAKIENITPSIARKFLEKNTNNRALKKDRIMLYVRQMQEGSYIVNGDTIRFDTDGVLIDGQNRLTAISKMPEDFQFTAIVVRGLAPDAFKTIDIGVMRNAGDIMKLAGHSKYAKFIPAMIRKHQMLFLEKKDLRDNSERAKSVVFYRTFTASDCIDIYEKDMQIIDRISTVAHSEHAKYIINSSTAGAIMLDLIRDRNESIEKVESFFDTLFSGAGLTESDPMLSLRNSLIKARQRIVVLDQYAIISKIHKVYFSKR